jgi:hypothetical protein
LSIFSGGKGFGSEKYSIEPRKGLLRVARSLFFGSEVSAGGKSPIGLKFSSLPRAKGLSRSKKVF